MREQRWRTRLWNSCEILRCHPVSNDVVRVKTILATPLRRCLWFSRSAISLLRKGFAFLTKARALSIVWWTQGLTIHLFGTCSQDCCFELPHSFGEAGCLLNRSVFVFRPRNDSGSPVERPCTVARNSSSRATS